MFLLQFIVLPNFHSYFYNCMETHSIMKYHVNAVCLQFTKILTTVCFFPLTLPFLFLLPSFYFPTVDFFQLMFACRQEAVFANERAMLTNVAVSHDTVGLTLDNQSPTRSASSDFMRNRTWLDLCKVRGTLLLIVPQTVYLVLFCFFSLKGKLLSKKFILKYILF